MTTTTVERPHFQMSGPDLIALIEAGDPSAVDEAKHRKSKAVHAAVEAATGERIVRERKLKTAKPTVAKAPRPTGRGSRGGDPIKALRADIADATLAKAGQTKADHMQPWWDAYKATNGKTEAQLKAALKRLNK